MHSVAAAAPLTVPVLARSLSPPQVIVIGGGFAGATVAKYIRHWSAGNVDVTLVESKARHTSCVMSNLVLNEHLKVRDLRLDYDGLRERYGVNVVQDRAVAIDTGAMQVRLRNGGWSNYDRLVLAPGIAFDRPSGWEPNQIPHAWIAGSQSNLLRNQIRAMPDDGTFVMTIPKSPYRCPPGPYERACLVADILGRRSGVLGERSVARVPRVIVLDANDHIQAEEKTFSRAFDELYGDIVEYYPGVQLEAVDSASRTAITNAGDFSADVLNIIAPHRAPGLLRGAGLVPKGERWAPVDLLGYESTVAGVEGVHIIGDSQASRQPKSAHMANSQAKICADAVLRRLAGERIDSEERVDNLTSNSACYSPITAKEASYLTAVYAYNKSTGSMDLTALGEAEKWKDDYFEDMFDWSANLWRDSFG